MTKPQLLIGDPAPLFSCTASNNPRFHFDTVAGRYIVLTFFGTAGIEKNAEALRFIHGELRARFDDRILSFFGVSIDRNDQQRVQQMIPGLRYFWDFDGAVSMTYGACDVPPGDGPTAYRSFTLVLDPTLRIVARIGLKEAAEHNARLKETLDSLPAIDNHAAVPIHAPVLIVPRILEPAFCRDLMGYYDAQGSYESGTMTEREGKTVGRIDYGFKRRRDCDIADENLRQGLRARINRRLIPEIFKAFQFRATHIERYIVACYEGEDGGFFSTHRDNTTKGTAHRKFACTINLNAEDYEGGELRFPEFGSRTYRAPSGGAVVFSCSLLHEATPVTKGRRYATLPFLYDDAGAKIRAENLQYLTGEVIDNRIQEG